jgi:hypothetical protein
MRGRAGRLFSILTLAVLLLALSLTACSGSGNCPDGFKCETMKATDYGDQWTLNVEGGTLGCKPVDIVVFTTDDGTTYAVNASASATNLYADITPILAQTTGDPGFLRTEGLGLCQG